MSLDFDLYWNKIKYGDEHALEILYKSAFRALVSYATDITGQTHLAEEAVQDIFLRLWQTRAELNIKGSFKAYLFKSVHNHALNIVRQQKTKKESVNLLTPEKTWQFISDHYMIDDNLIENIFSDQTEALIEKIIKELPDQCCKVFRMSRVEYLTNEEIATKLGLSENTVKTHIYRALQKIALVLSRQ